ncbi:unnamed protein product [Durusdinium trenchii]|uniref:HTH La-type RNA-binding domain-containing protein n=1 Tax=Durusdinium trenchii TaxID=1381693 RepID=A0ABP0HGF1_9DINO
MWSILQPRPVQRNQGLSGPPRVSSTQATPALKDVELVEPMMGGMHRGTADWKEPESGDKGSKRAKIEKHHAKSGGEVHDDTRLTSWEAAHQAKEILKRARPMPPPASPPATPPAPVLPPWPPVKAKENFTLKKDGEAVAISHPVLGDLEVPSGQAPEDFVNRKLKTLSKAIRKQVEYYFSDANWAKDEYLRSLADAEGFVGIQEIMDFKLLKQICADFHTIRESLQSSQLRLSADGQRLARAAA